MWQNTQSSITLYVYGVGECKSLYLFPYATGVEYHAQNREIKSARKLRDILRVWYNGEAVDGIGIAPPSYYFIRERTREWRFIFSKSYALADVNTVRIELRIPDTLSDAQ